MVMLMYKKNLRGPKEGIVSSLFSSLLFSSLLFSSLLFSSLLFSSLLLPITTIGSHFEIIAFLIFLF